MATRSPDLPRNWGITPRPEWISIWHLWKVTIPRRSITGRLVWGRVLRKHDGRKWRYRQLKASE
jgi:hypothetical protein